jgi:hypothetical protein
MTKSEIPRSRTAPGDLPHLRSYGPYDPYGPYGLNSTTCGSWSLVWFANSEFTWTTW